MKYLFKYKDEVEFKRLEHSLKRYYPSVSQKLCLEYYATLREGKFLGEIISTDKESGNKNYELKLPTNPIFQNVHGELKVIYQVQKKERTILFDRIEPFDILMEGNQLELAMYKGVMVSRKDSYKCKFKIDLADMVINPIYKNR